MKNSISIEIKEKHFIRLLKTGILKEIKEYDYNLNISLYVEKIIEDNLPSVEEALADLKTAWEESFNY